MTYRVQDAGLTFVEVSRRVYGSESRGALLASANPGVTEPLPVGLLLIAPQAREPRSPQQTPRENTVTLLVGGKPLDLWTSVSITRSVDSVDQVSLSSPFDVSASLLVPFSYSSITVAVGTSLLFEGTLVQVAPSLEQISASGYSVPGVLHDCHSPGTALTEYVDQTLSQIAESLCAPFGIEVLLNAEEGGVFRGGGVFQGGPSIRRDQTVWSFLSELAKQRGLLLASTERGELLIHAPDGAGSSVASLAQGKHPLISIEPRFDPQAYFSHITGVAPVSVFAPGGASTTVVNPFSEGVLRPLSYVSQDGDGQEQVTSDAKMRRMLGNSVNYEVKVATWRDANSALWSPGAVVSVSARGALVADRTPLMIRSVTFDRAASSETATLHLCLPGAFGGQLPATPPWVGVV